MSEKWKEVPDTNGKYMVSDIGRLAKILSPNGRHYNYADLYVKGVQTRKLLHRLILEVFVGLPPTEKHCCNHKNGNKRDNDLANLEWVTPSENSYHTWRVLGRRIKPESRAFYGKFGPDNPTSKRYIVTSPRGTETLIIGLNDFCKRNGLDTGTMSNIARKRYGAKTHKGWRCRYAETD